MIVFSLLIAIASACLPNPFMGYSPGYGGYYAPAAVPYNPYGAFARGPYRAEPQRGPSAEGAPGVAQNPVQPRFASQVDEIKSVSTLNCAKFSDKCRWANTQEEELDWSTLSENEQAMAFLQTLGVQTIPDLAAGVLTSATRKGWEGGQLVSDPLPCINHGLKVTATVWKSKLGAVSEQPKLQICTKNTNEEKFPLVNCNEFDIRNGVPMSMDIPAPNNPNTPAQIVFYGNNFIAAEGGALYLQDIVIDGQLSCNGETLDSHPILVQQEAKTISEPTRAKVNDNEKRSFSESLGPIKAIERAGLEAIDANPNSMDLQQVVVENAPISQIPSLFESCLALSCNPSDLSCKFWRSAGNNRWEIGVSGRVSNPLTGIHLPPGTAQKFLVAPFFDSHITSYTLVSEQLNIPLLEEVFFCFYEYYATEGLSISVCTDKMDCFYKKTELAMGEDLQKNKKWNIRCTKLPPGTYELRVIAENSGENKGEIGFLPIRLSRDDQGTQLIC
ncbi:unnamed protein product [Caenorhabditis angaria]|uniref:MAM domain-containing protein n=1 Tax=Caenorhabditis angaria TaxID=860376 RepID=A0A9P1NCI4_9PELO|nr:unnamed protein product [Caenorhabditis angaria]